MNRQLILAKRPVGLPEKDTWTLQETAKPEIKEGEFLVKQSHISLDPAMRGWMNDVKSYIPPIPIGDVMRAGSVGEVIESKNEEYKVGEFLSGWGGVQDYAVGQSNTGWHKVFPEIAPLPTFLGTLGMPGLTAYFGILNVGQIKEGEVVLVSGAAGAVGSVVGQIAKLKGCTVVGIAGGPEKCQYIKEELGYDAAIDYKNEDVRAALKKACPKGLDVYFDNVGGEILDLALTRLRMRARVVICGAISQYNNTDAIKGPSNYLSLLVNRARMEGFVILDYAKDYKKAAMEMAQWMAMGQLKSKEHIAEGMENFHDTFLRLFNGEKRGKLVLKL